MTQPAPAKAGDCYCYLPLYIFCGRHLLAAKLRTSSVDAADGATDEVARIVGHIHEHWPATTIVIRADSGYCRDDVMSWCEANDVQYVLGLAGNERLVAMILPEMKAAARKAKRTGQPARVFADYAYRTHKSLSAERRVIGKAEHIMRPGLASRGGAQDKVGEANPRFIVSIPSRACAVHVRAHLPRTRRDREPHQGVPDGSLRRSHTGADHAREPAAALAFVVCPRADVRGAPHRTCRHQARGGDLRHDPAEALEDRRAGHDQLAFASACPERAIFEMAARRV